LTEFTCNICGGYNPAPAAPLTREAVSCSRCGSNVRYRGLIHVLSLELFGVSMTLPEFPRVKSLRGMGTTDAPEYASRLGEKLDYRNTFFTREPRFDLVNPPAGDFGKFDFITSSEVIEHVLPPVETAFRNAYDLLKTNGVLVFTVPYSIEKSMTEHFPDIHEFGFAQVGDGVVMVNRTKSGEVQVFEKPIFHGPGPGKALEMREFTETDLKNILTGAGFANYRIYTEDYLPYGVVYSEAWSLPIAARKGAFAFNVEAARAVLEEWRGLRNQYEEGIQALNRSYWFRLGRKLGLF
jgi:SAM-dependent methyltransferase